MPVYNTGSFLSEAIDSILNQTLTDFELIIVDDGSTDNSLEIAQQYQNSDKRVSVHSQSNLGISKTRNILVSLATSDYLAWMDSDDVSMPERLKIQYSFMKENPNVVAIGTKSLMIDEQGLPICIWDAPLEHDEIDRWHIDGGGGAIIFPSSMMSKQAVTDLGGFDLNLTGAEDLSLFLQLAEVGKLQNIDKELLHYRQHIQSISHTDKNKILHDKQRVIDTACKRRGIAKKSLSISSQPVAISDTIIKWGWWSLKAGNISTSRKYAWKAIFMKPFKLATWKLFVCSLRGF